MINFRLPFLTLLLVGFFYGFSVAQTTYPDQNPNYRASLQKYSKNKDSLLAHMGETIQETYEAIDPVAEREERKIQRRSDRLAFRRALQLERARRPYPRFRSNRYNRWQTPHCTNRSGYFYNSFPQNNAYFRFYPFP